eukprot:6135028-Pyramimonas_sp.AAC.1
MTTAREAATPGPTHENKEARSRQPREACRSANKDSHHRGFCRGRLAANLQSPSRAPKQTARKHQKHAAPSLTRANVASSWGSSP